MSGPIPADILKKFERPLRQAVSSMNQNLKQLFRNRHLPDCRSDFRPCCPERPQALCPGQLADRLFPHQVMGLEQPVPQVGAQAVQCRAAAVDASGGDSVQLHPPSSHPACLRGPFPSGRNCFVRFCGRPPETRGRFPALPDTPEMPQSLPASEFSPRSSPLCSSPPANSRRNLSCSSSSARFRAFTASSNRAWLPR